MKRIQVHMMSGKILEFECEEFSFQPDPDGSLQSWKCKGLSQGKMPHLIHFNGKRVEAIFFTELKEQEEKK